MNRNSLIRQITNTLIALVLLFISVLVLNQFLGGDAAKAYYSYRITISPSPIASFIASPTVTTSIQSNYRIDPTIINALIGFLGIVLGAIIASLFPYYLQRRKETKTTKEQQQQQEKREIETTKTTQDRVQEYCDNLRTNPRIAYLQILDMNQSIEVKSIYVRLRLYKEAVSEEEIDRDLVTTQNLHDPDASLKASLKYLEYRMSKAMNPIEALHAYKHCVIVGDPGAGKTTLLKHLIMKSVDKELEGLPGLPLYIELNAFATSHTNDLLEFAAVGWEQYGFSKDEAQAYLSKELKSGNILVLLDGLDETFIGEEGKEAEENYRSVFNTIKNFLQRYGQSPIVVTVRKARYYAGAVLEGFTELVVLDFRPEDIRQFVNNWFGCTSEGQKLAKDLNDKLEKNRRTLALAANPLLLALITITYQTDHYLLDGKDLHRADIYERSVDILFTIWDAKRGIKRRRQFDKNQLKRLLEDVASHFHEQRLLYFSEEELLKVIAGIVPEMHLSREQDAFILAEIILKEITSNNGLLKLQAKKLYGFLHITFQEYFAAKKFAKRDISDIIRYHSNEPWWEEVILLVARYTSDASSSLQIFLQKNEEKPFKEIIFHTELMLAGRYLAASFAVGTTSLPDRIIAIP